LAAIQPDSWSSLKLSPILIKMSIRAIVVEDDDFTRLMISTSLKAQGIEVVAEGSIASDALKNAKILKPDLALLDLHLGKGPTGLDLAVELRANQPKIGIVILTSFEDPRLLNPNLPGLPFGAVYLNKKDVSELRVLIDAISRAVDFRRWRKENESEANQKGSVAKLSDTQLETLRLMAQGLSNAEIAKRRVVTEKSVETAIARLAKAMGLETDPSKNQRVHMARVYFRALGADSGAED